MQDILQFNNKQIIIAIMSSLTFVQQQQQNITDGFLIGHAVNPESSFMTEVITAAVIDDNIVRVPEMVLFVKPTLEECLSLFAQTMMQCCRTTKELTVTSNCRQLCKGQDAVYQAKAVMGDGNEYVMGMLFDGHGNDTCIRAIRNCSVPVTKLLEYHLDPIGFIHDELQRLYMRISIDSGSTATYARLSNSSVDCSSVGDSVIYVFINGKLKWKSSSHTMANPSEVTRLAHKASVRQDQYMKLLDRTVITQAMDGVRAHFHDSGLKLVPSMSLGHLNTTGYAPETVHIEYESTDLVRVVSLSDGVNDMLYLDGIEDNIELMTKSSEELVALAYQRYTQLWTIMHAGREYPGQKIQNDQWDDCSAFVLMNY